MPNTHTDGAVKLSLGPQAMLSSEGLALLPENTRGTLESAPQHALSTSICGIQRLNTNPLCRDSICLIPYFEWSLITNLHIRLLQSAPDCASKHTTYGLTRGDALESCRTPAGC
jgi:hypothetical protein